MCRKDFPMKNQGKTKSHLGTGEINDRLNEKGLATVSECIKFHHCSKRSNN